MIDFKFNKKKQQITSRSSSMNVNISYIINRVEDGEAGLQTCCCPCAVCQLFFQSEVMKMSLKSFSESAPAALKPQFLHTPPK